MRVADGVSWERLALRAEVEAFLVDEAALLDEWRLDEWVALFTEDGHYLVPATDARDVDPRAGVTIVNDDRDRLAGRVRRLQSRAAHREFPWSRVRHLVTNVRVEGDGTGPGVAAAAGGGPIVATASFVVYRFRRHECHTFVGSYRHSLVREADGSLRIAEKVARLDLEDLAPGTVSVIL